MIFRVKVNHSPKDSYLPSGAVLTVIGFMRLSCAFVTKESYLINPDWLFTGELKILGSEEEWQTFNREMGLSDNSC